MRTCIHCKIQVGGARDTCPLCQSPLNIDDVELDNEERYWPETTKLKKQSMFIKVILFLIISAVFVCLAIDFLLIETVHRHWSIPVLFLAVVIVSLVGHFVRSHSCVPKIIFQLMLGLLISIFYFGWYIGKLRIYAGVVMPIVCCVALVSNFIFSFIDSAFTDNSMLYILCNILVGIVPYIAILVYKGKVPIAWSVSLIIGVITFIGLLIFKGKAVVVEIQKRLHV